MKLKALCSILLLISASGCAGVSTTKLNSQTEISKLAVISFLQDDIKGFYIRDKNWGVGDQIKKTDVTWATNDFANNNISEILFKEPIEVVAYHDREEILKKISANKSSAPFSVQIYQEIASLHPDNPTDATMVIYPNAIDAKGRQHSSNALLNFALAGPYGLLVNESSKNNGRYSQGFTLFGIVTRELNCMASFNIDVVSSEDGKVIGNRKNIKFEEPIPNEVWPESINEYSKLDDETIKSTCLNGLANSIQESIAAIGLTNKPTEMKSIAQAIPQ